MSYLKPIVFALLATTAQVAQADPPPPAIQKEINALMDSIESSGCRFNRNGTWYAAADVRAHMQTKLNYISKRGTLGSTEEFIKLAASKSSVSGKPYLIQCGKAPEQPSATWLLHRLKTLRG